MTSGEADLLRRDKQRMRREIRREAAALPEDYRAEASRQIVRQVLALKAYREARVIMAYASLPEEPDTRDIIRDAVRAGKTVLLPRCVSPEEMIALPFTGWDAMEPGWLNIMEPRMSGSDADVPEPELILVPCVTAYSDGSRLGHGAGYYDRFLEGRNAETVCLCFRKLMRKGIPMGPQDRRMDRVIMDDGASY